MYTIQLLVLLNCLIFCFSAAGSNGASTSFDATDTRFEMVSGSHTCLPGSGSVSEDFVRSLMECRDLCAKDETCNYFTFTSSSGKEAKSGKSSISFKRCQRLETCDDPDPALKTASKSLLLPIQLWRRNTEDPNASTYEMVKGSTSCEEGNKVIAQDFLRSVQECKDRCTKDLNCNFFKLSNFRFSSDNVMLNKCTTLKACDPDHKDYSMFTGVMYRKLSPLEAAREAAEDKRKAIPLNPFLSDTNQDQPPDPENINEHRVGTYTKGLSYALQNYKTALLLFTCMLFLSILYKFLASKQEEIPDDYFEL